MKTIKLTSIIVVVFGLAAPTFGMEQAVSLNGRRPVATSTRTVGVEFNGPQSVATSTQTRSIVPKSGFFGTYSANTASEDAGAVLVIPAVDSNEFVLTASKDLNVMCRVFDKELNLAGEISGGSPFLPVYFRGVSGKQLDLLTTYGLGGGGRNTSCMYLQGYAAVFLMSVSFPLAPGPNDEKKEAEPNEPADVVWRQAEQELYGQPDALEKRDDPDRIYDAAKVDEFQTNLIKTFKHAANTRCLAPDEWVITVACGPGDQGGAPKMLVLRAKKSDIDSFLKGALTLEQFREKVTVVTSPGGARSWIPSSGRSGRL